MTRILMTAALAAGLAGWTLAGEGHDHSHHGKKDAPAKASVETLTGEIVDMACYMAHEGKGAGHRKCAKMCLLDGNPAGLLLQDGTLLLLVEDHAKKSAMDGVADLAGEQASVTGKRVARGGVQALVVEKIEAKKKA